MGAKLHPPFEGFRKDERQVYLLESREYAHYLRQKSQNNDTNKEIESAAFHFGNARDIFKDVGNETDAVTFEEMAAKVKAMLTKKKVMPHRNSYMVMRKAMGSINLYSNAENSISSLQTLVVRIPSHSRLGQSWLARSNRLVSFYFTCYSTYLTTTKPQELLKRSCVTEKRWSFILPAFRLYLN